MKKDPEEKKQKMFFVFSMLLRKMDEQSQSPVFFTLFPRFFCEQTFLSCSFSPTLYKIYLRFHSSPPPPPTRTTLVSKTAKMKEK